MSLKMNLQTIQKIVPMKLITEVLALCLYTQQQERDGFIIIVSKEGDGKSTLANIIGFITNAFQERFNIENNIYTPEDFKRIVYESKSRTIIADEGTSLFLRADANTQWGKERVRILSQMRSRKHIVIVTLTESGLARVEPQLLHDRVTALIRITTRGRLRWYNKQSLIHMEVDKNKRIVTRWPKATWSASFKPLPKSIYDKYNQHKDKSLEEANKDLDNLSGWLNKKQAMQALGVSRHTINKMVEDGELHAMQNPAGLWIIDPQDVRRHQTAMKDVFPRISSQR